ncbi:MAG: ATP-dependent helicase [Fidelibacterota bacterium]
MVGRIKLNDMQKSAVEAFGLPVLIFAGAGTGKTRVLTAKIAYLINKEKFSPENILAMTFTNKAAGEMKSRVKEMVGTKADKVIMGTFHSICARLLRHEIRELGFNSNFAIYDTSDQVNLIKSIINTEKIPVNGLSPNVIQSQISLIKNRMKTVEHHAKSSSPLERVIALVYPLYNRALQENNALDFDDLLLFPLKIFEKNPAVLKKYQKRFKYILVDEYQDTNRAQFLFVKRLAEEHQQITVVGDDDQSIYGWRGADISNILDFEKAFPNCEIFRLEQNYRSTQTILSAASAVVRNNNRRAEKVLWTEGLSGTNIGLMETYDELEEAEGILELLEREIVDKKRTFSDFVILYRTNAQSRALEDALRRRGIAYTIIGGVRFYERKEVKDLLAYLRLIVNPLDTVSLKRIVNFPPRGVGIKTVEKCEVYARQKGITLLAATSDPDTFGLKGKPAEGLEGFSAIISKYAELLNRLNAAELASALVDELGLVSFFKEQATSEANERLANVQELLNSIEDYCNANPDTGIRDFLEEVSLLTDIDNWNRQANSVTLMTAHAAKGLEFPVVFIAGMDEGLFPLVRSFDSAAELEEERRLFYVALTRAQEKVFLHYATNRRKFNGIYGMGIASRFVQEIPEELLERITFRSAVTRKLVRSRAGKYKLKQVRTVTSFNDLKRGDKVEHKVFGKGMVLSVSGSGESQKISVIFRGDIRKKLIAKYANLKRI